MQVAHKHSNKFKLVKINKVVFVIEILYNASSEKTTGYNQPQQMSGYVLKKRKKSLRKCFHD